MVWDPKENALGFTKEEEKVRMARNGHVDDVQKAIRMRDERRLRERQAQSGEEWENTPEGQAFKRLSESFAACKQLLARNPEAVSQARQVQDENYALYVKLKENLEKANRAPRCCYPKAGGELCKAPKMKGQQYCCMHLAMTAAMEDEFEIPPLDDANAIQAAITNTARRVAKGKINEKTSMRLAYFLQLAVTNVTRVNFEEPFQDDLP